MVYNEHVIDTSLNQENQEMTLDGHACRCGYSQILAGALGEEVHGSLGPRRADWRGRLAVQGSPHLSDRCSWFALRSRTMHVLKELNWRGRRRNL